MLAESWRTVIEGGHMKRESLPVLRRRLTRLGEERTPERAGLWVADGRTDLGARVVRGSEQLLRAEHPFVAQKSSRGHAVSLSQDLGEMSPA
jgi:hypothetical protein